jgi:hypothetical protein
LAVEGELGVRRLFVEDVYQAFELLGHGRKRPEARPDHDDVIMMVPQRLRNLRLDGLGVLRRQDAGIIAGVFQSVPRAVQASITLSASISGGTPGAEKSISAGSSPMIKTDCVIVWLR